MAVYFSTLGQTGRILEAGLLYFSHFFQYINFIFSIFFDEMPKFNKSIFDKKTKAQVQSIRADRYTHFHHLVWHQFLKFLAFSRQENSP
jgi:hypothetical protein